MQGGGIGDGDAGKVFDLFTHDGDSTFVGGVKFEDSGFHKLGAVELFGEGEDCGGFAGARRAVEEHVGELWVRCGR